MPSLKTFYRAVVMIVTGVIVVKGWQLYGPSTEQVKTFAVAAMEKAQTAWNASQQPADDAAIAANDPRTSALVAEPQAAASTTAPANVEAPQLVTSANAGPDTLGGIGSAVTATQEPLSDKRADGVEALMTRLQEMGGADAEVGAWGSSGELFRCCCKAKFAETSPLARHFEAVANEPTAAIAQVVSKVEAWRMEQQNLLR
jgi:hypothetical protein